MAEEEIEAERETILDTSVELSPFKVLSIAGFCVSVVDVSASSSRKSYP
jgi:hypothetical protein